uniref:Uncharacterized protein n=1 Tax=Arundo donax TaxID=35708 RepID=A0A0A9CH45_ARUDO
MPVAAHEPAKTQPPGPTATCQHGPAATAHEPAATTRGPMTAG